MIMSRTPLRISFCGGGTDIKDYYEKFGGAVVSTAINKHAYIIANERSDGEIWLKYSKSEIVKNVNEIEHNLLREGLKTAGVVKGIEIASMADMPLKGSGLGGSCSFTVGLMNALYAMQGKYKSPTELAEIAAEVEIDRVGAPIGKQDQYAAAFGGLNLIEFNKDSTVSITPVVFKKETKNELEQNLIAFFTGITRDTGSVLGEQKKNMAQEAKQQAMHKMKELAYRTFDALTSDDLTEFGRLLHENWELKKGLASNITNESIEHYYRRGIEAGALGGKLCGAGAGGYLVFYCGAAKQNALRKALSELREMHFRLEHEGSRIIYAGD